MDYREGRIKLQGPQMKCLKVLFTYLYLPWCREKVKVKRRILEWAEDSLLQGIFPTQGSKPGFPLFRQILC